MKSTRSMSPKKRTPFRPRVEELEARVTPATAFALSGTNLLSFDTATPTITQSTPITGVNASETLVGIDFRPQNGLLYGLGVNADLDNATLYAISTRTGFAGVVGTASSIAFTDGTNPIDLPNPATVGYGIDFNPAADRFRVVVGSLNFRVNPNTGLGVDGDNTGLSMGTVTGTNPDGGINTGTTTVDATAYTNNQPNNLGITTQYTLDESIDTLFIQTPPNEGDQTLGQTVTLGGNTLDFTAINGFDIPAGVNADSSGLPVTAGSAFAVLNVGGTTGLYSINLVNAQATFVGNVGNGTTPVQGLAVQSDLGGNPAIALAANGLSLLRFNTATPGMTTPVAIPAPGMTGGPVTGELLVGIDFRPATGQLYALGINEGANTGTLYLVDPQNGTVAAVGTPGQIAFVLTDNITPVDLPDPATVGYGFDFNPTVDRIRVTTSTGLNFRLIPDNGARVDGNGDGSAPADPTNGTNTDGPINGNGSTGVSGVAYTNGFGTLVTVPLAPTTQYTLDPTTNTLFIQTPPNSGMQTTPLLVTTNGTTPLDFENATGFDIPAGVRVSTSGMPVGSGFGFAVLTANLTNALYRIDLTTGIATLIDDVGDGTTPLAGLALADAPSGAVAFAGATSGASEGAGVATINLVRTGSLVGELTVTVNVTGGTATAGSDFVAGPYTATFADGAATASFNIALLNDTIFEGSETIVLTIASVNNAGVITTPNVSTVTITDNDPQQTFVVNEATGFALNGSSLISFSSLNPGAARTVFPITGVDANELLVGIDFRPQNGLLYGLGVNAVANTATLYLIARGGVATPVGTVGSIAFTGAASAPVDLPDPATSVYDIDFNPAVDRLRVVAGNLNFRVDPNTGLPIDSNGNLGDGNTTDGNINGGTTTVQGTAYVNNFANNGNTTTQYTLDASTNRLLIQNPPNAGTQSPGVLVNVGGTTLDFTAVKGFDILANVNAPAPNLPVTAGTGLAVLTVGGVDILYRIDLVTGAATALGSIASEAGLNVSQLRSVAFQSDLGTIPSIGLSADGTRLLRATTLNQIFSVGITGITSGERLVGIDFRPATGQLFGLGINGTANNGTLYRIDPQSGAAVAIGTPGQVAFVLTDNTTPVDLPDPAVAGYGFDFNPTVDRIRVTTSTGLNFRLNPVNGAAVDGNGNGSAPADPTNGTNTDAPIGGNGSTGVSAVAYTNSFGTGGNPTTPVGFTSQYTLDAATRTLFIQTPPNSGMQTNPLPVTLNGSPLLFTAVNGFDIPGAVRVTASGTVAAGIGIAALTVGSTNGVYAIDLTTGAATLLGDTGTNAASGLTLAQTPTGAVSITSGPITVAENAGFAQVTLTRTAGFTGAFTVELAAVGATGALPGTPVTVAFADGQLTATAQIPITDDTIVDGDETVTLTLSFATNGAVLGATTTATLTITDNDVTPPPPPPAADEPTIVSTGSGISGTVTVTNADGTPRFTLTPYGTFTGGIRVTSGDVTGDGVDDIITGAGAGGGPHIKVFDGVTGAELQSFFAFAANFTGGVSVAAADLNGDSIDDIIVGAGAGGGPHVKVFDGATGAELQSFFAYAENFTGGVNVAAGDLDNNGTADIITGSNAASSHVKVFDGTTLAELQSFFAYESSLVRGVTVAVTSIAGSDVLVTGSGSGIPSSVRIFNADGTVRGEIAPYDPSFLGGVRVAGTDNGRIVTGAAPGGGPHVKVFDATSLAELDSFFSFDPSFTGGVFVG